MYELCALLRQKKVRKPRSPSKPRLVAGQTVKVFDQDVTIIGRDTRYATAWFIRSNDGRETSVSRDMIVA